MSGLIESFGQRVWPLKSNAVDLAVTEVGGHLAPAKFRIGKKIIEPLSIAPWWNEKLGKEHPPIIRVLRGDFFCMPFGGNSESFRGEKFPIHGETANEKWKLVEKTESNEINRLHLRMNLKIRRGVVDKIVELRGDHRAIYQRHVLSKMSGAMNFGHHAMLKFQSEGLLSASPFRFAQVNPGEPENPALGGYSILKRGAKFSSLKNVPMLDGNVADLTRYPARDGFEDLVMFSSNRDDDFAWTAVVFPREKFLCLALKNPRQLASTVLWHSNGGRHYAPWNGRHRAVLGIEEVTSYFAFGIKESASKNPVNRLGIPTAQKLSPTKATTISYIMAVTEVPAIFSHVKTVRSSGNEQIEVEDDAGRKIRTQVDLNFLRDE